MKKLLILIIGRRRGAIALANATGANIMLIESLRSRGVVLSNDATDQAVVEAVHAELRKAGAPVIALTNDKATAEAKVTTLTTDRDAQKRLAEQNATALENEKTARKADRKVSAAGVVDAAIKLGICTVADRATKITALENSTSFEADVNALLATAPTRTTTTNGRDSSGKQSAALDNEHRTALLEYQEQFTAALALPNVAQNPVKAHDHVMTKFPALAEKLRPKKS